MSGSSAITWLMISCSFPLEHSSTKSALQTLYIVEYDLMVFRNWLSSPCFAVKCWYVVQYILRYVCSIPMDMWSLHCCQFRYVGSVVDGMLFLICWCLCYIGSVQYHQTCVWVFLLPVCLNEESSLLIFQHFSYLLLVPVPDYCVMLFLPFHCIFCWNVCNSVENNFH